MSKQKEIERLARLMGKFHTSGDFVYLHRSKKDSVEFDPFTRLGDAMMVAEKIGDLVLTHNKASGYWYAHFNRADFEKYEGLTRNGRAPAESITLAALAYLDATEKGE